jgi:hypothetical protein
LYVAAFIVLVYAYSPVLKESNKPILPAVKQLRNCDTVQTDTTCVLHPELSALALLPLDYAKPYTATAQLLYSNVATPRHHGQQSIALR